jgi:hypothetical protein
MAVTGMAAGARLHDSRRARIWDALGVVFRSRTAVVGLVLVLFWVVIAIAAPLVTRYGLQSHGPWAIGRTLAGHRSHGL